MKEQYLDFVKGRLFRQTLLCREEVALDRSIRPEQISSYYIASQARPVLPADGPLEEFRGPHGSSIKTDYAPAAGKKAFIVNRIGDFGFLVAMFLMFAYFGTADFAKVSQIAAGGVEPWLLTAICLLLFLGATGKSAQIPLYVWLPDAMAGPTPVSALIHAATMVTAGVYMIARSNVLYRLSPHALMVVAIIGAATALFAATIGVRQNDIKKVLAYSTVSQLGFMFIGVGVGAFTAGIFHLITHAFFKACLFLGSGSVIHAMGGEQDIRRMGGLWKKIPITAWTFLIATVTISGFPPLSGFFSKDEILASAMANPYFPQVGVAIWAVGTVAALFTAFYMFRLFFLTFGGSFRGTHEQEHHIHESPWTMTVPLIVLAALSVVGGALAWNHYLEHWLELPAFAIPAGREWTAMIASTIVAILGAWSAWVLFGRRGVAADERFEQHPGDWRPVYDGRLLGRHAGWRCLRRHARRTRAHHPRCG